MATTATPIAVHTKSATKPPVAAGPMPKPQQEKRQRFSGTMLTDPWRISAEFENSRSRGPGSAGGMQAANSPYRSSSHAVWKSAQGLSLPLRLEQAAGSLLPIQRRLAVGAANDPLEAEADAMAIRVMSNSPAAGPSAVSNAEPAIRRKAESAAPSVQAPHIVQQSLGSPGRPLDSDTRSFFEPRFGQDLSNVRIHADEHAAASARSIGARAYTAGFNLVFGAGEYNPRSSAGRLLMAHELAHYVQQSRGPCDPALIQRKLIASGDAAGFAAFVNSIVTVQSNVVVAANGEVSIQGTNVAGPPTLMQQHLLAALRTAIDDSHTINMEFIHGTTSTRPEDANVIGGSFALSRVDLDDVAAAGTQGEGMNGGSILVHEITEQTRKQAQGEAFPAAHATATHAEEDAVGATRGPSHMRQVNPTTIEAVTPYTYPDGHIVEVTVIIVNGNFTNVQRRTLPHP